MSGFQTIKKDKIKEYVNLPLPFHNVSLLLFAEASNNRLVVAGPALHVSHRLALPDPVHLLVCEHVVDVGVEPAGPRYTRPPHRGPGVSKVKRPHLLSNGRLR